MKVSVMTRYCDVSTDEKLCEDAAGCASEHGSNLLVLPGYAPLLLEQYEELSKKYNLCVLAEAGRIRTYLITPEGSNKSFKQLFEKSSEKGITGKVHSLYAEIEKGDRNFGVKGKECRVLLCGENNYLRNIRKEANKVACRYKTTPWDWGYDILINPAHTSMRRWPELKKRFEYLSMNNKTVLYTTNNKNLSWGTALRVYQNGSLLVDGSFEQVPSNVAIHKEKTWRLITLSL